ncbi:hypothetical protein [Actinacidiphila paucisporea]|uniref:Uncharacterized protein n=1 Tax=Actinacidiphila paucisporea TaxID=310782 RepID=A0A1M7NZC6_9ACTN|nr:hypothetical protein [Actinacidiphila paucisporea]SHN09444.1 hypothetical protein SAMN05216499_12072 [Actinacidiphila paucisporea]
MKGMNRWIDRHLWMWAALLVVLGTGILMAFRPSRSPIGAVLNAVVYAGIAVWAYRRRRTRDLRAAGSQDADVVTLNRMLAKGRIPDDAVRQEQMRGLVSRRRQQLRRARWVMPAFSVLLLIVAGLSIASHSWLAALPLVAAVMFFDGFALFGYRRQKRNLRRLDEGLS